MFLSVKALLLILQRYYFESESQPIYVIIHYPEAVAYPTKILFWKRITAKKYHLLHHRLLLLILQRYYFESESQQKIQSLLHWKSCCLSYKDTILKANHSGDRSALPYWAAVAYPTKILFWKRITAFVPSLIRLACCCLSYKDTILKANHSYRI